MPGAWSGNHRNKTVSYLAARLLRPPILVAPESLGARPSKSFPGGSMDRQFNHQILAARPTID